MRRSCWVAVAVVFTVTSLHAADWPQWLGPNRDGISPETGLLKNWPAGGPKLKWKITNLGGEAYSAPAIANGRIYLLANIDESEHVIALDEKDGSKIWSTKIGAIGKNDGPQYPGPRGTPTVDGDKVYALSSAGDIACVDLAKGALVWSKSLPEDFGGKVGSWSYTESPLVDGGVVVVSAGGETATIVALNKKDGSTAWKTPIKDGDWAAYGSPIIAEVGGVKQYVCFLGKAVTGVAAGDGKLLWRYEAPANPSPVSANIPTPLFHKGHVFATASGGKGGGLVKLSADKDNAATEVWLSDALKGGIGGFLRIGEHLYGTTGSGKTANLVCAEFATGKIIWQNNSVASPASLCVADGMLYVRGHNGDVALVEATPTGYKEHGRFAQTDRSKKPAWPYPVIANGCLYLRDMNVLLCYDLRDPKAGK